MWKVFLNPKKEYFFPILDIVMDSLKNEPVVIAKTLSTPFTKRKPNRPPIINSPHDPKIVLYFVGKDSADAKKSLVKQVNLILKNIPENMIDIIAENCEFVYIDDERMNQCGPSFTKKLNQLIFYSQGGFTESNREKIVNMAQMMGKKANNELAKEFDGENFYKYIGESDPFQ